MNNYLLNLFLREFFIRVIMLVVQHKLLLDQFYACEPSCYQFLNVFLGWRSVLNQTAEDRQDGLNELNVRVPGGCSGEIRDSSTYSVICNYSVNKGDEEGFYKGSALVREIGTEGV